MAVSRLLTLAEILDMFGVSRATIYAWIAAESFPLPLKVGGRSNRWPEHEVSQWLASRERAAIHVEDRPTAA